MRIRHAMILAAVLAVLAGCNSGSWSSGDRVLVSKCLYETGMEKPRRFDVVVFKKAPPEGPLKNGVPTNYIKRLLGLPGQILAIFFGQLFFMEPEPGEEPFFPDIYQVITTDGQHIEGFLKTENEKTVSIADLRDNQVRNYSRAEIKSFDKVDPKNLWMPPYTLTNNSKTQEWFEAGKFHIVRKPPDVMMALRRIVYDNDFQASDLGREFKRWAPAEKSSWKASDDFRDFSHAGGNAADIDWLRYQNLIPPGDRPDPPKTAGPPQLITDFESYNQFSRQRDNHLRPSPNWVGDLMLECKVQVDKSEGFFYMELSKGINRFRARFDLEKGVCTLQKQGPKDVKENKWEEMASQSTNLKKPGSYLLRFANFDARLTVWVDRQLPFGDGHEYPPPEVRNPKDKLDAKLPWSPPPKDDDLKKPPKPSLQDRRGPTKNDLEPASIGSQGALVQIRNLRLWRDSYYTLDPNNPDAVPKLDQKDRDAAPQLDDWANPKAWGPLRALDFKTIYVQPGHYLCLGDNSPASSDGRSWGLVPQRLMLGRALLVYYPFDRAGPIR